MSFSRKFVDCCLSCLLRSLLAVVIGSLMSFCFARVVVRAKAIIQMDKPIFSEHKVIFRKFSVSSSFGWQLSQKHGWSRDGTLSANAHYWASLFKFKVQICYPIIAIYRRYELMVGQSIPDWQIIYTMVTRALIIMGSSVNPIVYSFMGQNFRNHLAESVQLWRKTFTRYLFTNIYYIYYIYYCC